MKLRSEAHIDSHKKGLLKRLSIVLSIIIVLGLLAMFVSYSTRPQIQYSLTEANCSPAAIAARNKAIGADLKSCILTISAKNLQDKSVYVDYDGVGGGPLGGSEPLIHIYSNNGKFCYAILAGEAASFAPKATNKLTLRCALAHKPPKDYDESSDADPSTIMITGHSQTTIKVEPVR